MKTWTITRYATGEQWVDGPLTGAITVVPEIELRTVIDELDALKACCRAATSDLSELIDVIARMPK